MAKVGIVTDTTSCLPAELVKEYDIRIGSVNLILDGKVYRDQLEISTDEFWILICHRLGSLSGAKAVMINKYTHKLSFRNDGIITCDRW